MNYAVPRTEAYDKRANEIVKIIKDYDGVISSGEIQTLYPEHLALGTLKTFLTNYILPNYPQIQSIPRKGYIYCDEKKKPDNPFKNAEGYSDPTAGKALANLMMSSEEANQIPGEIWVRETGSYSKNKTELVLVIGASKGVVNYIPIKDYDLDRTFWFAGYCIDFTLMDRTRVFVDWRQLRTCGQNPFVRYKEMRDDVYEQVKNCLATRLKIDRKEVVKEVQKVVYETKEVPAQITKEAAIDFLIESGWLSDHDNEITKAQWLKDEAEKNHNSAMKVELEGWKAKAEAYELALRLMCGKEAS